MSRWQRGPDGNWWRTTEDGRWVQKGAPLGSPFAEPQQSHKVRTILLISIGALIMVGIIGKAATSTNRRTGHATSVTGNSGGTTASGTGVSGYWNRCSQAQAMPYNQLVKDPASLAGTCVDYKAEVFQFDSNTGPTSMLVEITQDGYGVWSGIVQVNLPNASLGQDVYQNDVVNIIGRVAGATTYQTQAGGSNTVPLIDVSSMSVSSGTSGTSGVSGASGITGTPSMSGASG